MHATHLTDDDIALLGSDRARSVCFCPTTERDLADGIGPARRAGRRRAAGSRSAPTATRSSTRSRRCAALELDERLATQERGHWTAAELLAAAPAHDSLGFADAGAIAVGQRADLVTIDTDARPRTAGTGADEDTAVFAATAADVTHVVVDGRVVATRGRPRGRSGRELDGRRSGALRP